MHPPKTRAQKAYDFGLVVLLIGWLVAFVYVAFYNDELRDMSYLAVIIPQVVCMVWLVVTRLFSSLETVIPNPVYLWLSSLVLLTIPGVLWLRDLLQHNDPVFWIGAAGLAHLVLALWGWWAYRHHFHSTA